MLVKEHALDYENLAAYLKRHCADYDRAYLIVRDWHGQDAMSWRRAFGPFVARLIRGDTAPYPEFSLLTRLEDSYVFQVSKAPCE
jgi:hypothetical protein